MRAPGIGWRRAVVGRVARHRYGSTGRRVGTHRVHVGCARWLGARAIRAGVVQRLCERLSGVRQGSGTAARAGAWGRIAYMSGVPLDWGRRDEGAGYRVAARAVARHSGRQGSAGRRDEGGPHCVCLENCRALWPRRRSDRFVVERSPSNAASAPEPAGCRRNWGGRTPAALRVRASARGGGRMVFARGRRAGGGALGTERLGDEGRHTSGAGERARCTGWQRTRACAVARAGVRCGVLRPGYARQAGAGAMTGALCWRHKLAEMVEQRWRWDGVRAARGVARLGQELGR